MDEKLMMEYLRSEGIGRDMSDREFKEKFKEFMSSDKYKRNSYNFYRHSEDEFPMEEERMKRMMRHNKHHEDFDMFDSDRSNRFFDRFNRMTKGMNEDDMCTMMGEMKDSREEHFNDSYAKYLVSDMYHFENGRKYVGEKFNMSKAKEICDKYKSIISHDVTHADVYVAINSQYHDYCELFKSWFGANIDQKIIESAIVFWFKDDDCKDSFKLGKYFKEY